MRLHVVRRFRVDGWPLGWAVVREGAQRATAVYDTPAEALKKAKALARAERIELWIHDDEDEKKVLEKLDFGAKRKSKSATARPRKR